MEVEEDEIGEEETGWKLINGDVFRFPPHLNALAAVVGAGAQLFFVTFLLLTCAITGGFVPTKRGAILTVRHAQRLFFHDPRPFFRPCFFRMCAALSPRVQAMIVLYTITSPICGFVSGRLYRQLGAGRGALYKPKRKKTSSRVTSKSRRRGVNIV